MLLCWPVRKREKERQREREREDEDERQRKRAELIKVSIYFILSWSKT